MTATSRWRSSTVHSLRGSRRKHCALAVIKGGVKIFRPAADPFPGGAGRPKFNQLEMVTTFTYKRSLVRIDARNFYRVIVVTDPQTQPNTTNNRMDDRLQYTAPQLARSVMP